MTIKKTLVIGAASMLLSVIALGVVSASPSERTQAEQTPLDFLVDVLTDADEKGVLPDTISILLADWIIENLIAPGTDETHEEVRGRLPVRGQSYLEFLLAVLTDADTNGALPDTISVLLADWIIEEFIAPSTGETPEQVEERLSGQAEDRAGLIALYEMTDGANWSTSTNWLSDRPLGEWHGVRTDNHARVIGLGLSKNQLSGRIPPELGRLVNLQEMAFHNNQLSGPIPPELGSLANLEWLSLGENQLIGGIPSEFGAMVNLKDMGIGSNRLNGSIPSELGNLTKLIWLDMGSNQLTGPIPSELGDLADLEGLHLGGNQLSGPIPSELGNLSNLRELSLWGNQLSGEIPPELGNLSSLIHLWLPDNRLSGRIPPELGRLANLEWLNLRGNQLNGPIPSKLGGLVNLTGLWLNGNQLSGTIPVELSNLTNLRELLLGGNNLAGCIPGSLGDVVHNDLDELGLPFCTATMERDRGALVALYEATDGANWTDNANWLSDRPFGEWYGVFTDSDGRVVILYLSENQLSGRIPPELGNLADLERLWLNHNHLNGPIPPELGSLANLEWLFLGGNQLGGCIPDGLGDVAFNDLDELGLPFCVQ